MSNVAQMPRVGSLDAIAMLAPLGSADREQVARRCNFAHYARGEVVLAQDEADGKGLVMVVSGKLSARGYAANGKDIVYAAFEAGQVTGEIAALDGGPRSATILADVDSEVAFMPAAVLKEVMLTHPVVGYNLSVRLARMNRASSSRMLDLATLAATQRIYVELLRIARQAMCGACGRCGHDKREEKRLLPAGATEVCMASVTVHNMPDQFEIASRTGTTRETVCRALSKLQKSGIIEKSRGDDVMVVRDMAALEERAELGDD